MIYEVFSFYEANPIIPNEIVRENVVLFKQQRKNTIKRIIVVNNPYFVDQFFTRNLDLHIKNKAGEIILMCPLAYFIVSSPQGKNIDNYFDKLDLKNVDWLNSGVVLNNNITFDLSFGGNNTNPYFTIQVEH